MTNREAITKLADSHAALSNNVNELIKLIDELADRVIELEKKLDERGK